MAMIRMPVMLVSKSHLYARGLVLRHEDTRETVATPHNFADAKAYCRRRGFAWRKTYRG